MNTSASLNIEIDDILDLGVSRLLGELRPVQRHATQGLSVSIPPSENSRSPKFVIKTWGGVADANTPDYMSDAAIASLFAELAEDDRTLAGEGMEDYARLLRECDEQE